MSSNGDMATLRERWAAARAGWVRGTLSDPASALRTPSSTQLRRRAAAPAVVSSRGWRANRQRLHVGGAGKPIVLQVKPDWRTTTTAVAGLVSVLLVATGLFYTNQANRNQQQATLRGQAADRYTAAVDQLGAEGAEGLPVRLGAIYALQTLAGEHPSYEDAVGEVLAAFIRTSARRPAKVPDPVPRSPEDVRAAVAVLSRHPQKSSGDPSDISNTLLGLPRINLSKGSWPNADLRDADLRDADLSGAKLSRADLTGADLRDADLSGADLLYASLGGAVLLIADLRDADLTGADLTGADLTGANLTGANLQNATLTGANLHNADLSGADLSGAELRWATNLTSAQIDRAKTDSDTRLSPLPPR
jgi:hypothetical protein